MQKKPITTLSRNRSSNLLIFIGLLIILSLACNLPAMAQTSGSDQEPGFVETSVVQTMMVLEGGQQPEVDDQVADDQQDLAPTDTFTPEITDTPSLTPTVTNTPTPEVAMVYISENTNCRVGQGVAFDWVTTVSGGTEAEAVGIDTSGDYWYIRRPDQPSTNCWLWGQYATPSGPYQSLPVYTPMPTPTIGFDFTIQYDKNIGNCGVWWYLQYRIDNTGGFTLESWKTTSVDHTGGSDPTLNQQDSFYDIGTCAPVGEQVDLTPGEAYYVNAVFDNNPVGHDITVSVQACTEDGLGGDCITKKFRHTP